MACGVQSFDLHLQPFDRRIDESRRTPDRTFLAEHIPGLERMPQLKPHPAVVDRPIGREPKLALRSKPERIEPVALAGEIVQNLEEVLPNEMLQHVAVMQRRPPTRQRSVERLAPE